MKSCFAQLLGVPYVKLIERVVTQNLLAWESEVMAVFDALISNSQGNSLQAARKGHSEIFATCKSCVYVSACCVSNAAILIKEGIDMSKRNVDKFLELMQTDEGLARKMAACLYMLENGGGKAEGSGAVSSRGR